MNREIPKKDRHCAICGRTMSRAKLGSAVCGDCTYQRPTRARAVEDERLHKERVWFNALWAAGLAGRESNGDGHS